MNVSLSSFSKYRFIGVLFVIVLWLITVFAKWKFNGLILGFDYGVYQPDGAHYTYRTLTFLGNSPMHSAELVSNWYQNHSYKMKEIDPVGLLPEYNGAWGLVKTRIFYSVLSVPFVYFWGIPGMLVVPALSLLALMLAPIFLVKQTREVIIACSVIFLLSTSPTASRWMLVNCTDSLLVGLFSLYLVLFVTKDQSHRSQLLIDVTFIALTALTRFSFPFWMGLSIILLLRRNYSRAFLMLFCALGFAIPSLLSGGGSTILPAEQETPLATKLLLLPENFLKISFFEVAQLAVLDRVLLALLMIAFFISIRNSKLLTSQIFLAFLLSGLVIGAINGTIGVNFRYQLPVLLPTVVVLTTSFSRFFNNSDPSKY